MLDLNKTAFPESSVDHMQFVTFNFEASNAHLCTAEALHPEIMQRTKNTNEKYYIGDHDIRESVFSGNMRDINLILENIVYMELLRRGYTVTLGTSAEKEVDFVCEKKDQNEPKWD